MQKINLVEAFSRIDDHWRPRVAAALNGQEVKLVNVQGAFVWHHHEHEDELFMVWRGRLKIEFRDQTIELNQGELLVIPRGVEHRPVADQEVELLLFEPAATRNTGNTEDPVFTAPARPL